jgi:hypothetical protein
LKEFVVFAIFAISALFVGVSGSNFGFVAYADDSSENDDEKKQSEKKLQEQNKEKIDEQKQLANELTDEFKIKLKEKYNALKNEFKEKYQQLRISKISELKEVTSDDIKSSLSDNKKTELDIKRKELQLLEYAFREDIKNLKLEVKEQFMELKPELKIQEDDRKIKIHDIINELKEKYKDKIKENGNHDLADLENYPSDYEGKMINVCHIPSGNSANAYTINISVNEWKAHMAHGDYLGTCEESDQPKETDESTNEGGQNIKIKLKEELAFHSITN